MSETNPTTARDDRNIIQKMYGGTGTPVSSTVANMYGGGSYPKARSPDYDAGNKGQTVGGIGNTDSMGRPIKWGKPDRQQGTAGEIVETPAGSYRVVQSEFGYELEPLEGASKGFQPTLANITHGKHHVGINPATGEVWYQEALSVPTPFSLSSVPFEETAGGGVVDPNAPDPSTNTSTNPNLSGSTQQQSTDMLSSSSGGAFSAMAPQGLSYQGMMAPALPAAAPKVNYVKALNNMLAADVLGGMLTKRNIV